MIQKRRQKYGLDEYLPKIPYIDYTDSAEYTFQIFDLPEKFYLGKNSFKILANVDFLSDGADIIIDVLDVNQNPIYHEISTIINEDRTRTVVVYIYNTTPIGPCTIYVASTLKRSIIDGTTITNTNDGINVCWTRKVLVSTSTITSEIPKFERLPTVTFRERRVEKKVFTTARLENKPAFAVESGSVVDTITIKSVTQPPDLQGSFLNLDVDLDQKVLFPLPEISGSSITVGDPLRISPNGYSIVTSARFAFSSSMEGGTLIVRQITASNPPLDITSSTFQPPDYSASIIRVLNQTQAQIYPPYSYTKTYVNSEGNVRTHTFSSILNATNFTASFLSNDAAISVYTESYLRAEFYNLEPVVGYVDSVRIRCKDVGSFGEYLDLGTYKITPKNLLTTPRTEITSEGLRERSIGTIIQGENPQLYWSSSAVNVISSSVSRNSTFILDGISITQSGSIGSASFVEIQPTSSYGVSVSSNTNYILEFDYQPFSGSGQLDVYITGSGIRTAPDTNIFVNSRAEYSSIFPPINRGEFVGTIRKQTQSPETARMEFTVLDDGVIYPRFTVRSGQWSIGKIQLFASSEKGFTPAHTIVEVPLQQYTYESEPVFEVEYLSSNLVSSPQKTVLRGLPITGSDPNNTLSRITLTAMDYRTVASASNWNRVGLYGGQRTKSNYRTPQFEISYSSSFGDSSEIIYLYQGFFTGSGLSSLAHVAQHPVFRDNIQERNVTGSRNYCGYGITVETIIFGKTGSFDNVRNSSVWASTYQGRAIVSKFDNSGEALLFNPVILSGSTQNIIGPYGNGPAAPKSNLDSWYTIPRYEVVNGQLEVQHKIQPTESGQWDFYLTSFCRVIKFEGRY